MTSSLRRSSHARIPVVRLIDEVMSKDDIQDPPDIKSKVDKRFYEVEIVQIDPARKKMRLHFKGYSILFIYLKSSKQIYIVAHHMHSMWMLRK